MKREAKLLLGKAVDSLILGVEVFNRPWDRGRVEAVLIHLDHSFEMLLKAAILQKGGRIRERREAMTIGFDRCVRVGLSDAKAHFLVDEDAVILRSINTLRDAAQHHLVDLSEQHLYIHAQAGVTLFRSIMNSVLERELALELPARVLPISTTPPVELTTLFDAEVEEVRKLLQPGKRQRLEAMAKLRGLAIVDGAIAGATNQPSTVDLFRLGTAVMQGKSRDALFPGVSTVSLTSTGTGPTIELRITKNEGIPVQLVREDAATGLPVVAVKRVDDLGYYNLGRDDLAKKVGLIGMMTTAMIWHLKLQDDSDCHKEFTIGKSRFHRYSQKAITRIAETLKSVDESEVWANYRQQQKRRIPARSALATMPPAPRAAV